MTAVTVYDKRLHCKVLGVACGASVEQWPTPADVKRRAKWVEDLQKNEPMFGTEYHYFAGRVLIRVNGKLKPSQAKAYEQAIK